jgi:ribose-phosphate pyrophosphokinase
VELSSELVLISGSAHPALAAAVASELGLDLGVCTIERFADTEMHVQLRTEVAGAEVFVLQPTGPVVAHNLFELLLVADACWRAGASRVNAVVPYFGYARADRRRHEGEALACRVVADQLGRAGFSRVLTIDLHSGALEGAFPMTLVHLSAVPLLAKAIRTHVDEHSVVVSPDLGAAKLAQRYARLLGNLPLAIVHKTRLGGAVVRAQGLVGDVRDRRPVVVDDMLSTGGTIEAAVRAVLEAGCLPDILVVCTHALHVGGAIERLAALPIRGLITTDSLPPKSNLPFSQEVVTIATLLGEAIARLRRGGSLVPLGLPD